MSNLTVSLSEKQYEFHTHCHPAEDGNGFQVSYTLYGGAAGGGKSHAICESAILRAVEEPGSVIAIMRWKKVDLDSTTKQVFLQFVCPEESDKWNHLGIEWNRSDDVMVLRNTGDPARNIPPSQIWWIGIMSGSASKSQSFSKFLSAQFSHIYVDEAYEVPEDVVVVLPTRIRLMRQNLKYRLGIKFASNPAPNWLKEWFLEEEHDGHKFIPAKIADNRKNLPPGYEKTFSKLPEYMRKRLLDGDWSAFEGQVFPGGVNSAHKIEDLDFSSISSRHWSAIQLVDPGLDDPTAALWAIYRFDDDYSAIIFLEDYLEKESTVQAHALRFKMVEQRLGLDGWPIMRLIDPDANKRSLAAGGNTNVSSLFADEGLHFVNAHNDTAVKTLTMAKFLQVTTERKHIITGEPGAPTVYFVMPGCKRTAKALTDLQWDTEHRSNGGQMWANRNKHLPDCACYGTAYLRHREKQTVVKPMPARLRMRYQTHA